MRIGDGYATVSGYKLPKATGRFGGWEGGSEDSMPQVRISVWLGSSRSLVGAADFSVKEKDEASLLNRFQGSSLNAFILRFAGD